MEAVPWIFSKSQFVSYPESFLLTSLWRLSVVPLVVFTGFQEEGKSLFGSIRNQIPCNCSIQSKSLSKGKKLLTRNNDLSVKVIHRTRRRNRSAIALTFRSGAKYVVCYMIHSLGYTWTQASAYWSTICWVQASTETFGGFGGVFWVLIFFFLSIHIFPVLLSSCWELTVLKFSSC